MMSAWARADRPRALESFGWAPVVEGGKTIALARDGASVSLEPGGQVELSGAPLESLHETCHETGVHREQCMTVGKVLGLGFLGCGFIPDRRRDEIPVMPKGRTGSCSITCRGSAVSGST